MAFAGHLLCSHTENRTSGRSVSPINVWGSLRSERSAPKDEPSSISLLRGIGFVSIEHHSILPIAALTGRGDFGDGVYQGGPASYCKTDSWSLRTVVVQGAVTQEWVLRMGQHHSGNSSLDQMVFTHTHCFWKSLLAVRVPTDLRSLRYHNQPSTSSGSVLSEVAGAKALLSAIPVVTDPGTEQGLKPL